MLSSFEAVFVVQAVRSTSAPREQNCVRVIGEKEKEKKRIFSVYSGSVEHNRLARNFLIAALAFVFAYFGVDKFQNPIIWIGWMPAWMEGLLGMSKNVWLQITGVTEILFAVMLLIPHRRIRQAGAILIPLHLVAVLTQTGWNEIAVRDIGLLLSSIALFFLL